MTNRRQAVMLNNNPKRCAEVYGKGRWERLVEVTDLHPQIITGDDLPGRAAELSGVEAVFSTWGIPSLGADELRHLPALKIVFYAAGSVRSFAPALLAQGIRVVSSWAANAVPVAEFSLAQILLSCKGYWRNVNEFTGPEHRGSAFRGTGNYGETVGIIGAGMVGRALIELLRPFALRVVVHDPYLSEEDARAMGVDKVSLEELFAQSYVVSNHLPNLEALRGMLDGALFECMRPEATFINTGRGAQVLEADLIRVLQSRPDLTALLDVTFPEPPEQDSPFYTLPNVRLSTHVAGSLGDEVVRMADYAIDEFQRWEKSEPLLYEVTPELLERMA
jgi:phosphoglycerate dehydrogenase-like enzyme